MKATLRFGTLLLAAAVAGPVVAIHTFAAESPVKAPATQPAAVVVHISDFNFTPKSVSISVGTTVTWINDDDVPHTATSKGESHLFDSKALDTDEKYSFTFTAAGTYEYYCKVHPHMTGVVVVK